MKVTVTDNFLNVRSGAPRLDALADVYLSPGDVIEVEESLYKGDSFEGINTWYKGAGTDNYYWSGGGSRDSLGGTIFYSSFLKSFDRQILGTQGDQTTIMVIDEGMVADAKYFDTTKLQTVSLDPGPMGTGHGNFIGGILAGRLAVIGLVPQAEIISVKYVANGTSTAPALNNLSTALQLALTQPGPLVINLSQGFTTTAMAGFDVQKNNITTLLQQIALQPNKFIICAGGDNLVINDGQFPATVSQCIPVGCLTARHINLNPPSTLRVFSPIVNFRSFDKDFSVHVDVGCSFATAVLTALTSCIISSRLPQVTTAQQLFTALRKFSTDRSKFTFGDLSAFQYQII